MTQQSQSVATRQNQTAVVTLKGLLDTDAYKNRFRQILKDKADQFCASLIQVGQSSRQLRECDPNTIIAAAITAAALDLPIDKNLGFAHIVPYKGQAQFQMGYKGFVQLAMRSGQYVRMNAKCINAEAFGGYDEVGDPIIKWELLDETKDAVGYAFAWKMVNGFTKTIYWTKAKVEAHARRYSQAYSKGYDTPWKTNFNGMALKTVIKDGLSHWGILSIEMVRAIKEDQGVKTDIDTDVTVYPDNEPKAPLIPGAVEIEVEKNPLDESNPDLNPQPSSQQTEPKPEPAPASESAPQPTGSASTPEKPLPNLDEPYPEVMKLLKENGIPEAQMIAYARNQKLMKQEQEQLIQLSTAKLRNFVVNWSTIVAAVKATQV